MYICDLYVKKLFLAYSQELIFTPAKNVYSIRKKTQHFLFCGEKNNKSAQYVGNPQRENSECSPSVIMVSDHKEI